MCLVHKGKGEILIFLTILPSNLIKYKTIIVFTIHTMTKDKNTCNNKSCYNDNIT